MPEQLEATRPGDRLARIVQGPVAWLHAIGQARKHGMGDHRLRHERQRKFIVRSDTTRHSRRTTRNYDISGFSWATMLLAANRTLGYLGPNLCRRRATRAAMQDVLIPPIETFVCPSDRDVTTQPDLPGLSTAPTAADGIRDYRRHFQLYLQRTQYRRHRRQRRFPRSTLATIV